MTYTSTGKTRITIAKGITVAAYLAVVTLFLVENGPSVIEKIIFVSKEHIILSTVLIFFLYALKSVSFGLPYALLYASVAMIYPFWWAFFINIAGIFINLQIPYFIGRKRGSDKVEQMLERFPSLASLIHLKEKSQFLFTFVLKLIGKIPHEITNLALGSLGIEYHAFVSATILALLPSMVSTMVIAREYHDPDSASFIVAVILFFALPLISVIYYIRYRRRSKQGR